MQVGKITPITIPQGGAVEVKEVISLRDYFAAMAMNGIMLIAEKYGKDNAAIAGEAYGLADAMLKAR